MGNDTLIGRDRFDFRPEVTFTLYEAAGIVNMTAFPNLSLSRNKIFPVWAHLPSCYIEWQLSDRRFVGGITNYHEDVNPVFLGEKKVEEFITSQITKPETLAILAMDRPALVAVRELQKSLGLDLKFLRYGFGLIG